jgi:hypothetical protein
MRSAGRWLDRMDAWNVILQPVKERIDIGMNVGV